MIQDKSQNFFERTIMRIATLSFIAALTSAPVFAQDWSGFYAGASVGAHDGEQCYVPCSTRQYDLTGEDYSLFGGYNMQTGSFVYGGELSISVDGFSEETFLNGGASDPDYNYSGFVDLKLRGGYVMGDALIFATLGYSMSEYQDNITIYDADGMLYGLGVDYKITDRLLVGAEYVARSLDGGDGYVAPNANTISLRLGYSF
jgi:outer membrane immunogenic protein